MELAARKCEAVFSEVLPEKDTVVISADTIVVYEDEILGKPKDEDDAYNTLKRLSGHIHQVYTGVTMTYFINGKFRIDTFADCANVYFRELTDKEIEELARRIRKMKEHGTHLCCSIGFLTEHQAKVLKDAGLDRINHNLNSFRLSDRRRPGHQGYHSGH